MPAAIVKQLPIHSYHTNEYSGELH